MAKVDTQSIPSETRIVYKRALQISTLHKETTYIKTRYPWRLPHMQEGGADVKPGQLTQRERFIYAKNHYALLDATAKARWAAANPEYHSFLFGYNFFMLEGLLGGGPTQYPQMIKTIQVLKAEVPASGTKTFVINAVDPTKVVVLIQGSARKVPNVFRGSGSVATGGTALAIGDTVDPDKCTVRLFGNSYNADTIQRGNGTVNNNSTVNKALSPNIVLALAEVKLQGEVGQSSVSEGEGEGDWGAPYVSALAVAQLTVGLPNISAGVVCKFSYEVIEHKAKLIHPYVSALSATHVTINWPTTPDVAATIGWEITEHVEGAVHPVLVSIAAEAVIIDWAEVPDAAADVSITVVEYL